MYFHLHPSMGGVFIHNETDDITVLAECTGLSVNRCTTSASFDLLFSVLHSVNLLSDLDELRK